MKFFGVLAISMALFFISPMLIAKQSNMSGAHHSGSVKNQAVPHGKSWGRMPGWQTMNPQERAIIKNKTKKHPVPPPHAKAWGKKYDWKQMSKAQKATLKGIKK